MTGSAVSIADANSRCTATGSAASAICASRGRRVRRPGRVPSPASGPASAAVRCLNCSVVAAPSAKHMLTAASTAASPGSAARPPARASTVPAPARAKNPCSSIAPAYRDRNTPSGTSGHDGSPAGPPAPGRPPSASASGDAAGSG